MSDIVKIAISAEAKVYYSQELEIPREVYEKILEIENSNIRHQDMDRKLVDIIYQYGFTTDSAWMDEDVLEDIEIMLLSGDDNA
ncbi:hypothetical protein [Xenorhabdus entomophaga]|uniref:hypothetical protein n=1 Tax=Xenorhabdus entomophaga TaxID=3136257 RepID=UPI0030F3D53A